MLLEDHTWTQAGRKAVNCLGVGFGDVWERGLLREYFTGLESFGGLQGTGHCTHR